MKAEEGAPSQGAQGPLAAGEEGNGSPPRGRQGLSPAHTLTAAQGDRFPTSGLRNWKSVSLCCFKQTALWSFGTEATGLIQVSTTCTQKRPGRQPTAGGKAARPGGLWEAPGSGPKPTRALCFPGHGTCRLPWAHLLPGQLLTEGATLLRPGRPAHRQNSGNIHKSEWKFPYS